MYYLCKMKHQYSGIYTITNISNGKIYVGQAINVFSRWTEHKCSLRNNYCENGRLQNAWNKYGESSFIFEVLVECEKEFLSSEEHYWATILNTHHRDFGYNLRPTHPEGKVNRRKGFKMSEETKAKIFTQGRADKIASSKKGIPRSQETKDKLSKYWKEKYVNGEVNPMQNRTQSQETKDKIRKQRLGKKFPKKESIS